MADCVQMQFAIESFLNFYIIKAQKIISLFMSKNLIKFFSYVVKENVEGLKALLGRKKL